MGKRVEKKLFAPSKDKKTRSEEGEGGGLTRWKETRRQNYGKEKINRSTLIHERKKKGGTKLYKRFDSLLSRKNLRNRVLSFRM